MEIGPCLWVTDYMHRVFEINTSKIKNNFTTARTNVCGPLKVLGP